jgi:hypothetical protein
MTLSGNSFTVQSNPFLKNKNIKTELKAAKYKFLSSKAQKIKSSKSK